MNLSPADFSYFGTGMPSSDALSLTQTLTNRSGSAFTSLPIALGADTSFRIDFDAVLQGTSGIAVALAKAPGTSYNGLVDSVALELDTLRNSWDVNGNHLSILQNGNVQAPQATGIPSRTLANGQTVGVSLQYDGLTNRLAASIDGAPVVSTTVDINAVAGSRPVLGFLGTTAGTAISQFVRNVSFSQFEPPSLPAAKPNVVIFLADDLGLGDTGYNGHPYAITPNLNALAAEGLRFDRFYVTSPICSPTRGACLTGRNANRWGMDGAIMATNTVPAMPLAETTLAEVLGQAGYSTGQFGKWHLSRDGVGTPTQQGFQTATGSVAAASAWISTAAAADSPYFAYVCSNSPHDPWDAVQPFYSQLSAYPNAAYYSEVAQMDAEVGAVRAAIAASGEANNTIFLFFSDNGANLRRGTASSNGNLYSGLRGGKWSLLESGVRMPALMSFPNGGLVKGGYSGVTSVADIFPTVLSFAQIPLPANTYDGLDVSAALKGGPQPSGQLFFRYSGQRAVIDRAGQWKAIRETKDLPWRLYNLNTDPSESNPINDAARLNGMVSGWDTWWSQV